MGDLGKIIGAKGFKKLSKVQQIAQSGHTASGPCFNANPIVKLIAAKPLITDLNLRPNFVL